MKMMRKALAAFLAVICIFASVGTLGVFAEGTSQVYAETNIQIEQGAWGIAFIYLDDLTELASLNVAVYYDNSKLSVQDHYNQVGCALYDSSKTSECLQYSYIFDGEGSKEKTNLFYFYYQINDNAVAGDTYFDIVITDAYTTTLQPANISGSRCIFTITDIASNEQCEVYGAKRVDTSVKQEFEIEYYFSRLEIASGSVEISYDAELFEFVEITNGAFLDGKIVDLNTTQKGSVYLSFLGTEYNYNYDLMKVKFRTRKNVTDTSQIKLKVGSMYDLSLNKIICNEYKTDVSISQNPAYIEDAPSMSVSATYNEQTNKVMVTVLLEKGSKLGAGDFSLNFDTDYLTYNSSQKGFAPNFFNVNDKNVTDGILKFSIISLANIMDGQTVLTVTFDLERTYKDETVSFAISGNGLTDSFTNPISLNFIGATLTIQSMSPKTTVTVNGNIDYVRAGQSITVTHEQACIVVYKDTTTNQYVVLEATKNEDGSYSYQLPTDATEAILAVKGDYNGDGTLTDEDVEHLQKAVLGKQPQNDTPMAVYDVNGDGKITAVDLALINAARLGKITLEWS